MGQGFKESALPAGIKLSSKGQFSPNLYPMGKVPSGVYSGPWAPVNGSERNRYLGLKFLRNRQVHFGWARLNVKIRGTGSSCVRAVLTGYGYETVPGKLSVAGRTEGQIWPRPHPQPVVTCLSELPAWLPCDLNRKCRLARRIKPETWPIDGPVFGRQCW
jgi:hypothetical protein